MDRVGAFGHVVLLGSSMVHGESAAAVPAADLIRP
jgi:hypothetical protein